MAEVNNRPFLEYQLRLLKKYGFEDIVLCVGYLASQIRDYFGDGRAMGLRIEYAIETRLLGTAGAVRNARSLIDDTFLLLNGDSYLDVDLAKLALDHDKNRAQFAAPMATIAVAHVIDVSCYGALSLDVDGRILAFHEKGNTGAGWVNAGIYILEPEVIQTIPVREPSSLEYEIFPRLLQSGHCLMSFSVAGEVIDIGTPDGYARFRERCLSL